MKSESHGNLVKGVTCSLENINLSSAMETKLTNVFSLQPDVLFLSLSVGYNDLALSRTVRSLSFLGRSWT